LKFNPQLHQEPYEDKININLDHRQATGEHLRQPAYTSHYSSEMVEEFLEENEQYLP
jgi:hypothetical protein